jgi:hypothetical protein
MSGLNPATQQGTVVLAIPNQRIQVVVRIESGEVYLTITVQAGTK